MRLLVQRVARASVEVESCVESRIGPGLVLTLGFSKGDSIQIAQQLAAKVMGLLLFPELMDPDTKWSTNVIDNGGEILVLCQQTLCAIFPKRVPSQERALSTSDARPIFDAFVAKLKEGYQEEMVVAAPLDAPSLRLEMTCEGSGVFEIGAPVAMAPAAKAKAKAAGAEPGEALKADVAIVTRALRRLPGLPQGRARQEAARAFEALGTSKLRTSLGDAPQQEADAFAEALDAAAWLFTEQQQEQITKWTGLTVSAEPMTAAAEDDEDNGGGGLAGDELGDDDLEKQLAELNDEVAHPTKGIHNAKRRRAGLSVKEEAELEKEQAPRVRPDWTGRAAPNTPAAVAARQWAANRKAAAAGVGPSQAPWVAPGKGAFAANGGKAGGKGKKGVRPPRRSLGIVSLDESSRLHGANHGANSGGFGYGQHTQAYFEKNFKEEPGAEPPTKQPKQLPKGTPTVAPMCPAPGEPGEEDL